MEYNTEMLEGISIDTRVRRVVPNASSKICCASVCPGLSPLSDSSAPSSSPFSRIQSGFTFVELCIVMVIVGVLVAAAMQGLTIYYQKAVFDKTKNNVAEVEQELRKFVGTNDAYPCPAALDAAPDTAAYGQADCAAAISVPGTLPGSVIRVGAVPTRALSMPNATGLDGWGQKLVYAVTEQLTVAPIIGPGTPGAISVVDKAGIEMTSPIGEGHYVVFSPGPDGKGAYSAAGVLIEACDDDAVDRENCDFIDPAAANGVFLYSEERSLAGNENNYDDVVAYRSNLASSDNAECLDGQVVIDVVNGEAECGPVPAIDVNACPVNEYLFQIIDGVGQCRRLRDCGPNEALRISANGSQSCQLVTCPAGQMKVGAGCVQNTALPPCQAGQVRVGTACQVLPTTTVPNQTAPGCQPYQTTRWNGTAWICQDPPRGTFAGYGIGAGGGTSNNAVGVTSNSNLVEPVYSNNGQIACRGGWIRTQMGAYTNGATGMGSGGTGTNSVAYWTCRKS